MLTISCSPSISRSPHTRRARRSAQAADYTCSTPDGRDVSPAACAERLARLVCGDREMLGEPEIVKMARYLVERQLQAVSEGLLQVVSRWDAPADAPVAPAGAAARKAPAPAGATGASAGASHRDTTCRSPSLTACSWRSTR